MTLRSRLLRLLHLCPLHYVLYRPDGQCGVCRDIADLRTDLANANGYLTTLLNERSELRATAKPSKPKRARKR